MTNEWFWMLKGSSFIISCLRLHHTTLEYGKRSLLNLQKQFVTFVGTILTSWKSIVLKNYLNLLYALGFMSLLQDFVIRLYCQQSVTNTSMSFAAKFEIKPRPFISCWKRFCIFTSILRCWHLLFTQAGFAFSYKSTGMEKKSLEAKYLLMNSALLEVTRDWCQVDAVVTRPMS